MISSIEVIDWTIDAAALLLSIGIAWRVGEFTKRQVGVLLVCLSTYAVHEAWEAGLVGGDSHRAVEQAINAAATVVIA